MFIPWASAAMDVATSWDLARAIGCIAYDRMSRVTTSESICRNDCIEKLARAIGCIAYDRVSRVFVFVRV